MPFLPVFAPLTPPISVVIADDSGLARESLRSMLEELPEVTLLGEACTSASLISLCLQAHPNVALVDIRMPDMDGLAVTRFLTQALPNLRIIIVTMSAQPIFMIEALRAGARGYLLKDLTCTDLMTALQVVSSGEIYLSPELATETLRQILVTGIPAAMKDEAEG